MTELGTQFSRRRLSALARELYVDGPWLKKKLQHWRPQICPFERLVPHVPIGASVLDVGCGCGLFLGLLAGTGRLGRGTGFDISPAAIAVASAMGQRLNRRGGAADRTVEFVQIDAGAPWPAGTFDIVSMIDVMHHIPPADQRRFFSLAAQKLSPGSALLYKDMCRRPIWRAAANRLHDLLLARQWIHTVPIALVESWAAEEGLQCDHAERIDVLWYGHELRVFRRRKS